jgi:hypothetical protein
LDAHRVEAKELRELHKETARVDRRRERLFVLLFNREKVGTTNLRNLRDLREFNPT